MKELHVLILFLTIHSLNVYSQNYKENSLSDTLNKKYQVIIEYDTIVLKGDTIRLEEHYINENEDFSTIEYSLYFDSYYEGSLSIVNRIRNIPESKHSITYNNYRSINVGVKLEVELQNYYFFSGISLVNSYENYNLSLSEPVNDTIGYEIIPIDTFYYSLLDRLTPVVVSDTNWFMQSGSGGRGKMIGQSYTSINFLIGLGYKWHYQRLSFKINTGVNLHFHLNSKKDLFINVDDSEKEILSKSLSRIPFNSFLNIELNYKIYKDLYCSGSCCYNSKLFDNKKIKLPQRMNSNNLSYKVGLIYYF